MIQEGYKIQFSKKPISWRNQKKPHIAEEQFHTNSAVKKLLEKRMIAISPSQNRNYLSKFFTLQEKTINLRLPEIKQLHSIENFKMEEVPALRELIIKDNFICKIDLKDAYVVVLIRRDLQYFFNFEKERIVYRYKSPTFDLSWLNEFSQKL